MSSEQNFSNNHYGIGEWNAVIISKGIQRDGMRTKIERKRKKRENASRNLIVYRNKVFVVVVVCALFCSVRRGWNISHFGCGIKLGLFLMEML